MSGGTAGVLLQAILSSPPVIAPLSLPVEMATAVLQQHINIALHVLSDEIESTWEVFMQCIITFL